MQRAPIVLPAFHCVCDPLQCMCEIRSHRRIPGLIQASVMAMLAGQDRAVHVPWRRRLQARRPLLVCTRTGRAAGAQRRRLTPPAPVRTVALAAAGVTLSSQETMYSPVCTPAPFQTRCGL